MDSDNRGNDKFSKPGDIGLLSAAGIMADPKHLDRFVR